MKRYRVYNICWDLDEPDELFERLAAKELGLPSEVFLYAEDDNDISLNGADQLSDQYGYCVYGFSFEKA